MFNFKKDKEEEKRIQAIKLLTGMDEWNYILEMILFPIAQDRENFHTLQDEKLFEAQVRTKVFIELLSQIEESGGRIEYEPPEEIKEEEGEEITSEEHFGVPHFDVREMRKKENASK